MSWKGFQKGLDRLPVRLKLATGLTPLPSKDESFETLLSQYAEHKETFRLTLARSQVFVEHLKAGLQAAVGLRASLTESAKVYNAISEQLQLQTEVPQTEANLDTDSLGSLLEHLEREYKSEVQSPCEFVLHFCHAKIDGRLRKREHKKLDVLRHLQTCRAYGLSIPDWGEADRTTMHLKEETDQVSSRNTSQCDRVARVRDRLKAAQQEYGKLHGTLCEELGVFLRVCDQLLLHIDVKLGEFQTAYADFMRNLSVLSFGSQQQKPQPHPEILDEETAWPWSVVYVTPSLEPTGKALAVDVARKRFHANLEALFPHYEKLLLVSHKMRPPPPQASGSMCQTRSGSKIQSTTSSLCSGSQDLAPSLPPGRYEAMGPFEASNNDASSMGLYAVFSGLNLTSKSLDGVLNRENVEPNGNETYMVRAQYSFAAQMKSDLSFVKGDLIRVISRTAYRRDWWLGQVGMKIGAFPANYTIDQS